MIGSGIALRYFFKVNWRKWPDTFKNGHFWGFGRNNALFWPLPVTGNKILFLLTNQGNNLQKIAYKNLFLFSQNKYSWEKTWVFLEEIQVFSAFTANQGFLEKTRVFSENLGFLGGLCISAAIQMARLAIIWIWSLTICVSFTNHPASRISII